VRAAKRVAIILLAVCLAASLALTAFAGEQTQARNEVRVRVIGAELPTALVDQVKSLSHEQLLALRELVRERLRETAQQRLANGATPAVVQFAGVVTAVDGNKFTVTKGGKGNEVVKTFTLTQDTQIIGVGNLKGQTKVEKGLMVKVKATSDGKALVVRLLPAKKGEALGNDRPVAAAKTKGLAKGKNN
jgi:hypothetical protein